MGSRQFNIRPATLANAAQRFQNSSQELERAIQTLQGRVLGAGSPWGRDEMGSIFAEAYTECSTMGLQAMEHLAGQLGSISEALQQMGQNLEAADQSGQTTFDQFRSKL
jgi:uncharacterized protein YukE